MTNNNIISTKVYDYGIYLLNFTEHNINILNKIKFEIKQKKTYIYREYDVSHNTPFDNVDTRSIIEQSRRFMLFMYFENNNFVKLHEKIKSATIELLMTNCLNTNCKPTIIFNDLYYACLDINNEYINFNLEDYDLYKMLMDQTNCVKTNNFNNITEVYNKIRSEIFVRQYLSKINYDDMTKNDMVKNDLTLITKNMGEYNHCNYSNNAIITVETIYQQMGCIDYININKYSEISKINLRKKYCILTFSNIVPFYWIKVNDQYKVLENILKRYQLAKKIIDQDMMMMKSISWTGTDFCICIIESEYLIKNFINLTLFFEKKISNNINIYYDPIEFGYEINNEINIKRNIDVCIVLFKQHENNIFESYAHEIYNLLIKAGKSVVIYLNGLPGSKLKESIAAADIVVKNIVDLKTFISINNIKKVFIISFPLLLIPKNIATNFFEYANKCKIDIYIFIAGLVSIMNEYVLKYKIKKVLTIGKYYSTLFKINNIHTNVYPTYLNLTINNIVKDHPMPYTKIKNLKKTFCHISRMTCEKRVNLLIESFKDFLKKTNDFDYKLYLIGDIHLEPLLLKLVEGYENNIILKNRMNHKNLFNFMKNEIAYLVMPSISEGISGVILEAMALGIPTIASKIHCTDEIITDSYNGLFFEYVNYEEYSKIVYTSFNPMLNKILQHDDTNKNNLTSALHRTHNNIELYTKLSNNCLAYIKSFIGTKNNLNVHDFFDF